MNKITYIISKKGFHLSSGEVILYIHFIYNSIYNLEINKLNRIIINW